jgi:hypothetical protein
VFLQCHRTGVDAPFIQRKLSYAAGCSADRHWQIRPYVPVRGGFSIVFDVLTGYIRVDDVGDPVEIQITATETTLESIFRLLECGKSQSLG